ncbi:DEAD-box ATP-dependent RNA helicase 7 [Babesia sp. Xinjiang]|uniref:DEAD-box ATP-dependent RNA helicase 7 n=1 Tax=Babesia sp. Xinjiang TaxID=462227 RepID=UPI000A218631|nr:DEAD-box ATP-dependent RNA helicase 7 [Babesia sp. Xinjiang]ORM39473.1 DEAD-box ATP-dependent RNA helicase 7 [Babesia sp. Xinjiang]
MREWVEFSHLNFDPELIKHLKLFGLKAMKPFQYIIGKCLIDALGSMEASSGKAVASKYIFHNTEGSGRSIGYILPLLHLYARKEEPNKIRDGSLQGSTLIVMKDGQASRSLGSLITAMNPAVNCLVLDALHDIDDERGQGKHSIRSSMRGGDHKASVINKISTFNEISATHTVNNILVISLGRLRTLLTSKSAGFSPARLKLISCVIFDDLTSYLEHGGVVADLCRRIRSAKRALKITKSMSEGGSTPNANEAACRPVDVNDVHVVCVVDSLGETFCRYAADHLGGYWVYDFKNGTKQRLVGDGKTDAVRLEVDLEEPPEIVNVAGGDRSEKSNLPIEHSICKVVGGKSKRERIYALQCLVYHYLNLPTFQMRQLLPQMLKRPRSANQCIIFVANRSQQRQLCALECFRDTAARLGSDLTVQERAANLNSFRDGSRPIMIATDASISGCVFDNVLYVINYHPPKSAEVYRGRAAIAGKNSNSLCITLYSKEQYSGFCNVLKTLGKRVSIHVPPSRDYMLRFNAAWLEKFASELVELNPSFIAPFQAKAQGLLCKYTRDELISKSLALLLGDGCGTPITDTSILSGRRGFTAVTVFDGGSDFTMSTDDLKRLVQRLLPDVNVAMVMGRYARTESGYVIDVATEHVAALLEATADEPNVCFEVSRQLPRMLIGVESSLHKAKGHMSKLPWRRYKIRRLQLQKRMV